MANETKPARRKRTNFAAEHQKLTTYCRISIQVIGTMIEGAPDPMAQFFKGQSDALKSVLRQINEKESE